ncbi:MAG: PIN domain-containing protein [Desulfuromonadales bacterium]|nr:PIN domain-containing protein [Desulfuromonadales bacterium]
MRVCIDTNILAYAEGLNKEVNQTRKQETISLLDNLSPEMVVIPAQVLGELFRVLTGKAKRSTADARTAVMQWSDSYETVGTPWTAFQAAFDLTTTNHFQIWDALIMSIAAENRCRMLVSEDMQHDFTYRGVTIVNPYTDPVHPLLAPLLM